LDPLESSLLLVIVIMLVNVLGEPLILVVFPAPHTNNSGRFRVHAYDFEKFDRFNPLKCEI